MNIEIGDMFIDKRFYPGTRSLVVIAIDYQPEVETYYTVYISPDNKEDALALRMLKVFVDNNAYLHIPVKK